MTHEQSLTVLCRDCGWAGRRAESRCPSCRSRRLVRHAELGSLSIAHIDCDAFYASVEKRDDPSLADKPLIVGGGKRGVVSTCCYIARIHGVRSAMPMFKALALCPKAVVLKPDMEKYVAVSRQIRAKMEALTPLVEPLSLDEAFLDLTGTERLHKVTPAESLARLAREIEADLGVTISVGLAPNKFLAKIASELDKPRGFAVVGKAEAVQFLDDKPVTIIFGVGPALAAALEKAGFQTVGDLRRADPARLMKRFGAIGQRLARLSRAEDNRAITPHSPAKTLSAETTFNEDIADPELLDGYLWRLAEKVSARLKAKGLAGRTVTLKLKTAKFRQITRRVTLGAPTSLADGLYRAAKPLLEREAETRTPYRLIGVGASDFSSEEGAQALDLFDPNAARRAAAERAMDDLRERFGRDAILKGRGLR